MKFNLNALAVAGVLAVGAGSAHSAVVYSNDFDAAAVVAAGVTASALDNGSVGTVAGGPYAGSNGKSWSGNFFANLSNGNPITSTTLTLSNLGVHTQVSVDMMLGFLNSWDSTNGSPAPDFLEVLVDGTLVYRLTTTNASGNFVDFGGGTQIVNNGQIDTDQFFSDDLVDMGTAGFLTFAHSASSLTLTLRAGGAGWQGGRDEYWGMDALSVSITGTPVIPEPGSLALVLAAAAAAAAAAATTRRRR